MGGRRYGEGWKTWRWGGAGGGLRTGGSLGWGGQDPDFGGGVFGRGPRGVPGIGGNDKEDLWRDGTPRMPHGGR